MKIPLSDYGKRHEDENSSSSILGDMHTLDDNCMNGVGQLQMSFFGLSPDVRTVTIPSLPDMKL